MLLLMLRLMLMLMLMLMRHYSVQAIQKGFSWQELYSVPRDCWTRLPSGSMASTFLTSKVRF